MHDFQGLHVRGMHLYRDSPAVSTQVRASRAQPGEERALQAQLRAMAARRSSMERCNMVHGAIEGDGGSGGIAEGLRELELHLASVQSSEQAHAG